MKAGRSAALLALCLALQAGILLAVLLEARSGCAPSTVVLGLAMCFIPYAGAILFSGAIGDKRSLDRLALMAALIFGGALLFGPPLLSDDLYRYLWEGRLWLEGLNPYRLAPDDAALEYLRDGVWKHVNNKPLASIYPPLSQLLFVAAAFLGGTLGAVKILALFAHLFSVAAVARISTRPEASLALAINPLLLSEGPLNGHFDILTGVALLIAAWALTRHRYAQAGLAVVAAVGLKLVGLLAVPLFLRRSWAFLGTVLASGLLVLPLLFFRAPVDPVSGPGQFATRWRGNESLFFSFDWLSRQLWADGTAGLVARAAVALLMLVLLSVILRRRVPAFVAIRALLWAMLLLSPQIHPWYLAWLLPLEVAAGGRAGLVWSAAVLCAYAPLDRWFVEGVWDMPLGLQIFEYGLVLLALLFDPRRPSLRSEGDAQQFLRDSSGLA